MSGKNSETNDSKITSIEKDDNGNIIIDITTRIEFDDNTADMLKRSGAGSALRISDDNAIKSSASPKGESKKDGKTQNIIPINGKEGVNPTICGAVHTFICNYPIPSFVVIAFIINIIVFLALNVPISEENKPWVYRK